MPGPTPEDLRQKYEQMPSKALLRAVRSKGEYTDLAMDVILGILIERGLDPEGSIAETLTDGRGPVRSHASQDYLVRARREIEAGRLWRAKEILGGNLPTRGYDLTLYEAYGALLAQMGDTLEAGRFLFLSGTLDARYREPVELYLRRFGEQDWTHLVGTFPTAAKLPSIAEYPESVSKVLRSLGGTETVNIPAALSATKSQGITAGDVGCIFVLLFIVASLIVGAIVIVSFLTAWVFG